MRANQLHAYALTLDNTVWLALGAGLLAGFLVFLVFRFVLGWGTANQATLQQNARPARGSADEERDPFVHGGTTDRRHALRRGGNPIAVIITDAEGQGEPLRGYVLDRSTGGLCLAVPEPVEEGSVISVKTTNAPQTTPWIQVEVRNCRPISDSEWELGCKFEKTPPWGILLLFG